MDKGVGMSARSRLCVVIGSISTLLGCRADATEIRRIGVIALPSTAASASSQAQTQQTRLDACLARGRDRYGSRAAIRAVFPKLDLASRELKEDCNLQPQRVSRERREGLRGTRVLWVYGHLVVIEPNDETLSLMKSWTLTFAKQEPKKRDFPIVRWDVEANQSTWRSNVFALQFELGMFRAAGLDEPDELDERPSKILLPYRLREIESRASQIAIPENPPIVRYVLPSYRGTVMLRATVIEFLAGDATFCLPVLE